MKWTSLALVIAMSGCTLVGAGAGAGLTKLHNNDVESEKEWGYVAPVLTGAAIGLVIDLLILRSAGKGLGSLGKQ